MKLLLLTSYFPPEKAASPYLAENRYQAFADAGFEMVVYTPMPTRGVDKATRKAYRKKRKEELYDGRMVVHRFCLMRESTSPLLRAVRYTLMCFTHILCALFSKDARDCDVLFLSSTPPINGLTAAILKRTRHIPIVYNLQDIFPDSLVGTGMVKKDSLIWRVGARIERTTYNNVDVIIVISEEYKRNLLEKAVPEEKIRVIYNWVEEDAVFSVDRVNNPLFDTYNIDRSKFIVTHCGNIGKNQNFDLILEAAERLIPDNRILFVIVGEGVDKERVKEIIYNRNLTNVLMLPFQPYSEISNVFSLGDVSLVCSKPGVGGNSMPSKTWSIMSASRPVLLNCDENEVKMIVEKNHCGVFTPGGDIDAFVDSLQRLMNNPDECIRMGKNGRDFILNNLTAKNGANKYVRAILEFNKA